MVQPYMPLRGLQGPGGNPPDRARSAIFIAAVPGPEKVCAAMRGAVCSALVW